MPRRIAQARHLRKASTPAERRLWSRLRNHQLYGYKFRRQHPIGDRVVDFFCHEAQLAIELDGSGHGYAAREAADRRRTSELLDSGIRVIRFWNEEVVRDIDWVIEAILLQLDPEKSRWGAIDTPSPQSSP
jgi:very-short-patch-repair endonuclease